MTCPSRRYDNGRILRCIETVSTHHRHASAHSIAWGSVIWWEGSGDPWAWDALPVDPPELVRLPARVGMVLAWQTSLTEGGELPGDLCAVVTHIEGDYFRASNYSHPLKFIDPDSGPWRVVGEVTP